MQKFTPIWFLSCALIILASCGKEKSIDTIGHPNSGTDPSSVGKSEVGTWTFVEMHAITYSSVEMNDGFNNLKTATISDYTTQNNTGTIKFDGSTMTSTGLSYSLNTTAKTYMYTDNVLEDSMEIPFAYSLPAGTASSGTYKKIGSDSLYVQSGVFTGIDPNGGTTQGLPSGYKLKWDGDKMYMSLNYESSKFQIVQGISQKIVMRATTVTTLKKQ